MRPLGSSRTSHTAPEKASQVWENDCRSDVSVPNYLAVQQSFRGKGETETKTRQKHAALPKNHINNFGGNIIDN